jgi:hypothetical protein
MTGLFAMSSSGRVEGSEHFTRAYREVRRKASARREPSRLFSLSEDFEPVLGCYSALFSAVATGSEQK